ncbi:MAG: hypothetical protein ACNA70_03620 [Brevefilum sp.]
MINSFQNLPSLVVIGAALLAGLLILRFFFKFAWKFVRVALILISMILIAGYFLGYLDIIIR